jgi:hypothetical protein
LLDFFLLGQAAETLIQAARVVHENDIGTELAGCLADGSLHALIDLLDQTGQRVARLAGEYESDEVIPASDRAQHFSRAGGGAGHPIRKEAGTVVGRPDLRAGFQGVVGLHRAGEQKDGAGGKEAWGHGNFPFCLSGRLIFSTHTSVSRMTWTTDILNFPHPFHGHCEADSP